MNAPAGILLVNKPIGKVSFSLVTALRKITSVSKIGHAGTLDPFASGLMVMLIGKEYTRQSDSFLNNDKEYIATVHLGIDTETYDPEGATTATSELIPSADDVATALKSLTGWVQQTPPMYSAKKSGGKKLYELARKGITIDRPPVLVHIEPTILSYEYPYIKLAVKCSKGTYIRSIAHDLGKILGCGAHLSTLHRTRSGNFHIDSAVDGSTILDRSATLDWIKNALL